MAVNPSTFGPCPQFVNAAGEPAVGDKLFFYAAGTTTKQNTYTDSTGSVANSNPIILNSLGEPSKEIWFTNGESYKMVWAPSTDTDPPTNPIRTFDDLRGINDTTVISNQTEWILSTSTPTFVSATSFTVPGNQTATFTQNRRLKTTNTSGSIYSTISNAVYTTLTTVTVVNDSGVLDSGLSDVSYGILNPAFRSYPSVFPTQAAGNNSTNAATTAYVDRLSGTVLPTIGATVGSNQLTISAGALSLDFRSTTSGSGTITRVLGTPTNLVISSGSTLGSSNGVQSTIVVLALNAAGTIELAAVNLAGGVNIFESSVISTTAEGGSGAADSASVVYSTTARSNVAYRVLGYITSTQATAGTWATAPSIIQAVGGLVTLPRTSFLKLNNTGGALYGSTNTCIRRWGTIETNLGSDFTYADSATLGMTVTINSYGVYAIVYGDCLGAACNTGISKNSTQLSTSIASITAADRISLSSPAGSNVVIPNYYFGPLNSGDIIRTHADATGLSANPERGYFSITRVA